MMRVVAFVDHEVGCRAAERLGQMKTAGLINLVAVLSPKRMGHEWWPDPAETCADAGIEHFV